MRTNFFCKNFSGWFDTFWSEFLGGHMHFSFLKSVILKHLSQKSLISAKKRYIWAWGARNTDFWVVVKTPDIIHGSLGRLLMVFGVYSLFSKIGDFSVFGEHFRDSQNRGISAIPKLNQYFDSHSKKKNGSTFDRALNEDASYFSSRVIPIVVLRICYFFGPRVSKTSKLATLRRPLSVQKVVHMPTPQKKSTQKCFF